MSPLEAEEGITIVEIVVSRLLLGIVLTALVLRAWDATDMEGDRTCRRV